MLIEITHPEIMAKNIPAKLDTMVAAAVTDCKSLYDTLTMERVLLTDKRLSMESAILRQALDSVLIKWVKREQMLSDCLTQSLAGMYARMVFTSGKWTLGPDGRAPSTRNRKPADPASPRTTTQQEAEDMNIKFVEYVTRMEKEPDFDSSIDTFFTVPRRTSTSARSRTSSMRTSCSA